MYKRSELQMCKLLLHFNFIMWYQTKCLTRIPDPENVSVFLQKDFFSLLFFLTHSLLPCSSFQERCQATQLKDLSQKFLDAWTKCFQMKFRWSRMIRCKMHLTTNLILVSIERMHSLYPIRSRSNIGGISILMIRIC